jgi:hypothetical protein
VSVEGREEDWVSSNTVNAEPPPSFVLMLKDGFRRAGGRRTERSRAWCVCVCVCVCVCGRVWERGTILCNPFNVLSPA